MLYDNTKLAVARILPDGTRERTRPFTRLVSHYAYKDRFGRPGKGNDRILWGRAAIRSAKLKVPNHTASEATDVQHR